MRQIGVAVAVAVVIVAARPAAAQETLAWKFAEKEVFYLESVTQTDQELTSEGKATKQTTTITTTSSFRVIKLDKEKGQVELEQKILGVKVEPESDPTAGTAGRYANLLKGLTLAVTLSPSGQDLKVSGYTNWLKTISGGNEAVEKQLRGQMLPEENLRQELLQVFGFLPGKPVSPGATWAQPESLQMGVRGSLTGEATFKFEGRTGKGDRITVTRALKFEPYKETKPAVKPEAGAGPPPEQPFIVDEVKVTGSSGEYLFDAGRGRLVEGRLTTTLDGPVRVATAEKKAARVVVDVKQTTTRTLRMTDKKPGAAEPGKG